MIEIKIYDKKVIQAILDSQQRSRFIEKAVYEYVRNIEIENWEREQRYKKRLREEKNQNDDDDDDFYKPY